MKVTLTSHRCDDRCRYARGTTCRCSCGGAGHGRGWAGHEDDGAGSEAVALLDLEMAAAPLVVARPAGGRGRAVRRGGLSFGVGAYEPQLLPLMGPPQFGGVQLRPGLEPVRVSAGARGSMVGFFEAYEQDGLDGPGLFDHDA